MISTTQTEEREQWRARILRALTELQSDAPAIDPSLSREDGDGDAPLCGSDV